MLILGIETSTLVSSVAVACDGETLALLEVARGRGHVELLTPGIQRAYGLAGCTARDLDGVAAGIGPGLFTSMRVGIATAKTIASALEVPAVGVSSLDLLASGRAGLVCACIDARRDQVFAAIYEDGTRTLDPSLWNPAELRERARGATFVGDGARMVDPDGIEAHPSADVLCRVALEMFARGEGVDPATIEPLYVRRTEAEIKWEQRGVTIKRPDRITIPKRAAR